MPTRLAVSAEDTPYSMISFKAIVLLSFGKGGGCRIEAWQPPPFSFYHLSIPILPFFSFHIHMPVCTICKQRPLYSTPPQIRA
jgi:hypothetical protein